VHPHPAHLGFGAQHVEGAIHVARFDRGGREHQPAFALAQSRNDVIRLRGAPEQLLPLGVSGAVSDGLAQHFGISRVGVLTREAFSFRIVLTDSPQTGRTDVDLGPLPGEESPPQREADAAVRPA
jgi:hypothetical protein